MDTQQYTYYAFISYQRKDEKWAKWLQRKLENYKLPVANASHETGLMTLQTNLWKRRTQIL